MQLRTLITLHAAAATKTPERLPPDVRAREALKLVDSSGEVAFYLCSILATVSHLVKHYGGESVAGDASAAPVVLKFTSKLQTEATKALRAKGKKVDTALDDQISKGRLYACITSRPGQCGRADGYILEGSELAFYKKKLDVKKDKKH